MGYREWRIILEIQIAWYITWDGIMPGCSAGITYSVILEITIELCNNVVYNQM